MTFDALVLDDLKNSAADTDSPAAKYVRLESKLCEMIAGQILAPGFQFPADKIFASQLGVSLGTLQKALTNLRKRGLITRTPKRGTFVAERQVGENDVFVFRFRDQKTGELILPQVRTLSVTATRDKGPWNAFLKTDLVVCIERLMQIGIEPAVYSQVFIHFEHGESLLHQSMKEFAGFSVHRHIERCFDAVTLRSESKVQLGQFIGRAAQQLTLEDNTPSLIWEVSSYTVGDKPSSFQRIQIPPDHRPIEFRRAYNE